MSQFYPARIALTGLVMLLLSQISACTNQSSDSISSFEEKPTSAKEYSLSKSLQDDLRQSMVWVESGSFAMGSNHAKARNREKPVHKVSLDGFYISRYELTQDIFTEIMGWNISYFSCDKCPVNNISWSNIQLFVERLNSATGLQFRLPTEAEWEYAARGGSKSGNFLFSGSNNIDDVAWFAKNSQKKVHPVGLKTPNELGLYDMTGNLWEFCQDNMSRTAYSQTSSHNPFFGINNPTPAQLKRKSMKVLRGGGYEFTADESLVFIRDGATNNVRMADIGFRLAMSKNK